MYFRIHYINPPETIIEDIYKLEHSKYVIFKNGNVEVKNYWDLYEKFNTISKSTESNFDIAKNEIDTILNNYIKKVVKNENNFGLYISGGIDSSLVAALCQKNSDKQINTFSIGFYEAERNEANESKRIAQFLGTNHHELYIEPEMAMRTVRKIPYYYSEPFADASEIPTIILNEYAKENGIEITITGDGADQLFCGCSICDEIYKAQKVHNLFNPLNIHIPFALTKAKKS